MRYFSSVRTNGEGWFRMHPPMHALYHLPNLVSHPTPQPISKPTPWRTYASKQAAFGQQRARAAGLFVPGFSEAGFGHVCTPPAHPPPQTLRFPRRAPQESRINSWFLQEPPPKINEMIGSCFCTLIIRVVLVRSPKIKRNSWFVNLIRVFKLGPKHPFNFIVNC